MNRKAVVLMIAALFFAMPFATFSEAEAATNDSVEPSTVGLNFADDPDGALTELNKYKKEGCEDSTWDSTGKTLTLNGVDFSTTANYGIKMPEGGVVDVNEDSKITVNYSESAANSSLAMGITSSYFFSVSGDSLLTIDITSTATTYSYGLYYCESLEGCGLNIKVSGASNTYGILFKDNKTPNIENCSIENVGCDYGIQIKGDATIKDSTLKIESEQNCVVATDGDHNLRISNSILDIKRTYPSGSCINLGDTGVLTIENYSTLKGSKTGSEPLTDIDQPSKIISEKYKWVQSTPTFDWSETLDFTTNQGIEKAINTLKHFCGEGSAVWEAPSNGVGGTLILNGLDYVSLTYETFNLPENTTVRVDEDSMITVRVDQYTGINEGFVFSSDNGKLVGNGTLIIKAVGTDEASFYNSFFLNFKEFQCNLELANSNLNTSTWRGITVMESNLSIRDSNISIEGMDGGIFVNDGEINVENSVIDVDNFAYGITMQTTANGSLVVKNSVIKMTKISGGIDLNDPNTGGLTGVVDISDSEINIVAENNPINAKSVKVNNSDLNIKSINGSALNCEEFTIENCTPLLGSTDAETEPSEPADMTNLAQYKWLVTEANAPPASAEKLTVLAEIIAAVLVVLIAAGVYVVFFTKL